MSMTGVPREFPVTMEKEVVVVGGGAAGVVAAIAAARNGAETLIIESSGSLGGSITIAGIRWPFKHMTDASGEIVVDGIPMEILNRLTDMGGTYFAEPSVRSAAVKGYPCDPELYKLLLDEMCAEAGVKILYQTYAVDAIKERDVVRGVTFVNKSGKGAVLAKVVIDASGDGDIAASAGAKYEKGRPEDGLTQAVSMRYDVGGVDLLKFFEFLVKENPDSIDKTALEKTYERFKKGEPVDLPGFRSVVLKAFKNGDLTIPRGADGFGSFNASTCVRNGRVVKDMLRYATDDIFCIDPTNVADISEAWIYGKERLFEYVRFFRKYLPGHEHAYILTILPMLGIRESRRIIGDYVITVDDVFKAKEFPDSITKCEANKSTGHDPRGVPQDKVTGKEVPRPRPLGPPEHFNIPYRALLPMGLENILVAGRCISYEVQVQYRVRGVAVCQATGQAAGTAAAMAVRDHVTPRNIDIKKLRATLSDQGANL